MIATGMCASAESCCMDLIRCSPSIRGILRSTTARAGGSSRRITFSASRPSLALTTRYPSADRMRPSIVRMSSSSSTIRIDGVSIRSTPPDWQVDDKRRALTRLAVNGNRSAKAVDDRLGDMQAQAEAAVMARPGRAMERIEDARQHLRLDADAVIPDGQRHVPGGSDRADVDRLAMPEL